MSDSVECEAQCQCLRGQSATSHLNYVLAELESMLTTRVSETVNRFALLAELCSTNGTL